MFSEEAFIYKHIITKLLHIQPKAKQIQSIHSACFYCIVTSNRHFSKHLRGEHHPLQTQQPHSDLKAINISSDIFWLLIIGVICSNVPRPWRQFRQKFLLLLGFVRKRKQFSIAHFYSFFARINICMYLFIYSSNIYS